MADASTSRDSGADAATPDSGPDAATPDSGDDAATDASSTDTSSADAGGDAGDDAATDAGADAGSDARTDTGPVPDAGAPIPVQCRSSEDCSGPSASCNREAPGGICLGCTDGSCPSGTSCSEFATCIRDCDTDDDCGPGWECLGSGRCALVSCGSCPAPYVCDEGRCKRPPCPCPTGWTCEADLCMEP